MHLFEAYQLKTKAYFVFLHVHKDIPTACKKLILSSVQYTCSLIFLTLHILYAHMHLDCFFFLAPISFSQKVAKNHSPRTTVSQLEKKLREYRLLERATADDVEEHLCSVRGLKDTGNSSLNENKNIITQNFEKKTLDKNETF